MSTEALERACATAHGILANVKPDQLDDPTPCASWKVRDLVNHVVGGSHWFASTVEAGGSESDGDDVPDFTGGDFVAAHDQGIKASIAAFGVPGALGKPITLPFGEFPGAVFMGFATIDQFQHAWDLARATGQPSDLDPEFAAQLLAQCRQMDLENFRGPDGKAPFGPEVEVPTSAPVSDQLAGFLGRTP